MPIHVTVQSQGTVVLPEDWLRKYRLKTGDTVVVHETQAGLLIQSVADVVEDRKNLFSMMDDVHKRTAHLNPEVIEKEIDEALEETRHVPQPTK